MFNTLYNNPFRIQLAGFLSSEMAFGLDWWMLIHFFTGILIMFLIIKYKLHIKYKLNKYWLLFILLVIYEIIELYFFKIENRFFTIESINNQIIDVVVGMLGGLLLK